MRHADANAFDVAHVSDPPNALSEIKYASSAPIAKHSLSMFSACGGPIEMTLTIVSGNLSFIVNAASKAFASSGFKILGTPSLISVFVLGSIRTSVVSGTCFAHTIILKINPPC